MNILLITPAPPDSRQGNRVTAVDWARVLRHLGHRVTVREQYQGGRWDVLVALHARRSHGAIVSYRKQHPRGALVLAMTGTDLYQDLPRDPSARESVRMADRIVVLQDEALNAMPAEARAKAHVIVQAVSLPSRLPARRSRCDVAVVGHLRAVKDPLLPAKAARLLPEAS